MLSIYDIKLANKQAGQHFFDKDAMCFFNSRVSNDVYEGLGGVFFVTSEKGPSNKRAYTVRQFMKESSHIKTVGEFNELSRYMAHKLAKQYALEGIK